MCHSRLPSRRFTYLFEFEFATPLAKLDTSAFRLEEMVDTLWKPVKSPFTFMQRDSVSPRHFKVEYPWAYETKYRLAADTMAAIGIYGKPTRPISQEFSTKKEEDYCSLTFHLSGLDPAIPSFVELLSGKRRYCAHGACGEQQRDFQVSLTRNITPALSRISTATGNTTQAIMTCSSSRICHIITPR